jgi:diguanylate cyclase (GGDEF)-like protein
MTPMLTYAVGLIQDVQLICFAVVFVSMALGDRANRSLRWLSFAYIAGSVGAVFELGSRFFPAWLANAGRCEAPAVGYACLLYALLHFVDRGWRIRWVAKALIVCGLPFYLFWSSPGQLAASATLVDGVLAIQTGLMVWLLLTTKDTDTVRPRTAMAGFLAVYSVVETARVAVFLAAHKLPGQVSPAIEIISAIVYAVSCSVLPLAFIWMMNARLHAGLLRQSVTDPLTQVLNRRGLSAAAERELARCQRFGHEMAIVVADIDHFKRLNDAYGHARGDFVLSSVGTLFSEMLRKTDGIGRLGGEEFVLLLPGTDASGALELVERLRAALESYPFMLGEKIGCVTASFGITAYSGRTYMSWDMLLPEADAAMYAAKKAGRNRAHLFSALAKKAELPKAEAPAAPAPIAPAPGRVLNFRNPMDEGF